MLLLLLGGCGTLVTVGAMRAFQGFTAPIDVANDYLDAARAGTDLTPYACRPDEPPRPEVVTSREQNLNSVEIDGRSFAEVEGSLTLEERLPARVTVFLSRRGDEWCVSAVEVGQP